MNLGKSEKTALIVYIGPVLFNIQHTEGEMCDAKIIFPDSQMGLTDVKFHNRDITEPIDEMLNTAAGPDGFSAMFLNKCKDAVETLSGS